MPPSGNPTPVALTHRPGHELRALISDNGREASRRVGQAIADLDATDGSHHARLHDLDHGGGATTYEEWSSSDEHGR